MIGDVAQVSSKASACRVALRERVRAARERRVAVDDRHEDEVVAIRRPPDVAARLVFDDVDAIGV